MARRVFFSFHYQLDIWRINQIRNLGQIVGTSAAGFHDGSLWEEAKRKGDVTIKRMIDDALYNTSVTVVCIGSQTAGRKYINYEIQQSIARGNGILGLRINGLRDRFGNTGTSGITPHLLSAGNYPVFNYLDHHSLATWIEDAARRVGR